MSPERKKEFSFNQDPFQAAEEIKGSRIIYGDLTFTVLDTVGFTREENSPASYQILTQLLPGELVGIGYRGFVLPAITTRQGSCILIQSVEVTKIEDGKEITRRVKGPGNIGKLLGLEKDQYTQITIDDPLQKIFKVQVKPIR